MLINVVFEDIIIVFMYYSLHKPIFVSQASEGQLSNKK